MIFRNLQRFRFGYWYGYCWLTEENQSIERKSLFITPVESYAYPRVEQAPLFQTWYPALRGNSALQRNQLGHLTCFEAFFAAIRTETYSRSPLYLHVLEKPDPLPRSEINYLSNAMSMSFLALAVEKIQRKHWCAIVRRSIDMLRGVLLLVASVLFPRRD